MCNAFRSWSAGGTNRAVPRSCILRKEYPPAYLKMVNSDSGMKASGSDREFDTDGSGVAAEKRGRNPAPSRGEQAASIVLIHRQRLLRECLAEVLASSLPEFCVESICDPEELSALGGAFSISCVILYLPHQRMPDDQAAEYIKGVEARTPGKPLIIMSDSCEAAAVRLAFDLGARGYIPSSISISEVTSAIRFVASGGTYVPAAVLTSPPAGPSGLPETNHTKEHTSEFSPRKLQVLQRLQQGKPNKIIAYELGMAEATVKVHIRQIMKRLNARNRTQIVLMTKGLLD
jgi:DNA-binding NarL/FixJ family response regulator